MMNELRVCGARDDAGEAHGGVAYEAEALCHAAFETSSPIESSLRLRDFFTKCEEEDREDDRWGIAAVLFSDTGLTELWDDYHAMAILRQRGVDEALTWVEDRRSRRPFGSQASQAAVCLALARAALQSLPSWTRFCTVVTPYTSDEGNVMGEAIDMVKHDPPKLLALLVGAWRREWSLHFMLLDLARRGIHLDANDAKSLRAELGNDWSASALPSAWAVAASLLLSGAEAEGRAVVTQIRQQLRQGSTKRVDLLSHPDPARDEWLEIVPDLLRAEPPPSRRRRS
ncbi:MAG: hypothetical protein KF729_33545 [Sandaracinaceae bacterium]|nr:hypothetical protein [Sandaracinaceae bacterium]